MKRKNLSAIAGMLMLLLVLVLSGCGGSGGSNTPAATNTDPDPGPGGSTDPGPGGNNYAAGTIVVSEDVVSAATWTGVRVIESSIQVNAALTIMPGTVVKFGPLGNLVSGAGGAITADGAAAATPIVFTSVNDDAHGGDTNKNGAATAPAAGDWAAVSLGGSGSRFNYCEFYYGGRADKAALALNTFQATVTNSVFAHNGDGSSIDAAAALDAHAAAADTVITGNTFYDNKVPVRISAAFSMDDSNRFDNVVSAPTNSQPNRYNAIFVSGCGHVASTITWSATEVPFVIGDSQSACVYETIDAGGILHLGDNVTVKFFPGGSLAVNGVMTAVTATTANKIVFTSVKDDAHGGDTNADGSATAPAAGNWEGIAVFASGSAFDSCGFFYGGAANTSVLVITPAGQTPVSASVRNSVFAHNNDTNALNAAAALDAGRAAAGTLITGNTFYGNKIPLEINTKFSMDGTNVFSNPTDTAQTNKYNGIFVYGCGEVTSTINWSETKVPFVIGDSASACTYEDIRSGGNLVLADNVVLKFHLGGQLTLNGSGTLTKGSNNAFTSIKDDSRLGDTNGDGSGTAPATGDWEGIYTADTNTWATGSDLFYDAVTH